MNSRGIAAIILILIGVGIIIAGAGGFVYYKSRSNPLRYFTTDQRRQIEEEKRELGRLIAAYQDSKDSKVTKDMDRAALEQYRENLRQKLAALLAQDNCDISPEELKKALETFIEAYQAGVTDDPTQIENWIRENIRQAQQTLPSIGRVHGLIKSTAAGLTPEV